MKKKKNMLIGFALAFLALLLGETYCLLNQGDLVLVIGVGVVLLIMGYLLLDALFDYIEGEPEQVEQLPGMNWEYGQMEKLLSGEQEEEQPAEPEEPKETEAERLQKGMFVMQKQAFAMLEKELKEQKTQGTRDIESLKEELSTLLKAEIKYERENTTQIISNNMKKLDQMTSYIEKLTHDLQKEMQRELQEIKDVIPGEIGAFASADAASPVDYQQSLDALWQQTEQITELLRHIDGQLTAGVVPESSLEPEEDLSELIAGLMPEEAEPEEDVMIPEISLEPEEEVMIPEISLEPEEDVMIPEISLEPEEEIMIPEINLEPEEEIGISEINLEPEEEVMIPEISLEPEEEIGIPEINLEPEVESEPEPIPEPEPVPAPTPAPAADPNKPLSPDEIAALFASMGQ